MAQFAILPADVMLEAAHPAVRLHQPDELPALLRVIRAKRADVLHLHGYGATTFGRLAAAIVGLPAAAVRELHENRELTHVFDRRAAGSYDPTKALALFGGYYDSGNLIVGDLNGDQRMDVVNGTTTFPHRPNTAATFDALPGKRYTPNGDYGYYSTVSDTNGDGFPDLASLASTAKTIQTSLQSTAGGTLALPVTGAAYTQAVVANGVAVGSST